MILGWKLLLAPGISLVNLSVVPVAWRPPPLVFGVELADLFKDPAVSVGMISWFIGVAMNLAGSVQYPVQVGWFVAIRLERLLPLTGLGIAESGVDRCVAWSFIIIATVVFDSSWLAIAILDFGSS